MEGINILSKEKELDVNSVNSLKIKDCRREKDAERKGVGMNFSRRQNENQNTM